MIKPSCAFLFLLQVFLSLSGCGNSGSGGGGAKVSDEGAFSVSKNSVNFEFFQNASEPQSESILLTVTGSNVSYVVAGYQNGQAPPSWLSTDIVGSGTSYSLIITPNIYDSPPGAYSTTFLVGTADAEGNSLRTQAITVHLMVRAVLVFTQSTLSASVVYGSDSASRAVDLEFTAGTDTIWTVSSSRPWLSANQTSGIGSGTLKALVNAEDLMPGSYEAVLTITDNSNPQNRSFFSYSIEVLAPQLTVDSEELLLGGDDGLGATEGQLFISIDTGAKYYPFSVTLSEDDGENWLSVGTHSSELNETKIPLNFSVNAKMWKGGSYTGAIDIAVQVNQLTLFRKIPVTFNKEANRIVVSSTGVAFSSGPTRSMLSRTLKVRSAINRQDVSWVAVADQDWLTVTPSGLTGGDLHITAAATGLAAGEIYFGTITVSSPDGDVENEEKIRVGLTVLAQEPADINITLPATDSGSDYVNERPFITASPVEPLFFTNVLNEIRAYNVFTGTLERTFTNVVSKPGGMTVSGDGDSLFIQDQINFEVVEVNAKTGALIHKYPATAGGFSGYLQPAYMRPNAKPVLVGAGENIYDLVTREKITLVNQVVPMGSGLSVGPDPSLVVTSNGSLFKLKYSALKQRGLTSEVIFTAWLIQGSLGQACINSQGSRVYTASGAPYTFPGISTASGQLEQDLPGAPYPNSIICGWNGLVIGGANAYYDAEDIFIYNGFTGRSLGNLSSSSRTSYRSLAARSLMLSGDAERLAAISENGDVNLLRIYSVPSVVEDK